MVDNSSGSDIDGPPLPPKETWPILPPPVVMLFEPLKAEWEAGHYVHATLIVQSLWGQLVKFLGVVVLADSLAVVKEPPLAIAKRYSLLFEDLLTLGGWTWILKRLQPSGSLHDSRHRVSLPLDRVEQLLDNAISWRNKSFAHGIFTGGKNPDEYRAECVGQLRSFSLFCDAHRATFERLALGYRDARGGFQPWPVLGEQLPVDTGCEQDDRPGVVQLSNGSTLEVDLGPLLGWRWSPIHSAWSPAWYEGLLRERLEGGKRVEKLRYLHFDPESLQELTGGTLAHEWREKYRSLREGLTKKEKKQIDAFHKQHTEDLFAIAELEDGRQNRLTEASPCRPDYIGYQVIRFFEKRFGSVDPKEHHGVIIIEGVSGVGKSYVARFFHELMRPYFGVLSREWRTFSVRLDDPFLRSSPRNVVDHVRRQWPPTWQQSKAVLRNLEDLGLSTDADTSLSLTQLMGAALVKFGAWNTAFVLLDGLDCLGEDSEVPDLIESMDAVPESCFFVLFTRPERRQAAQGLIDRLVEDENCLHLAIDPESEENRRLLRHYLKRYDDDDAELLMQRAGNRFLYVAHFMDLLQQEAFVEVDKVPPAEDLYREYLQKKLPDQLSGDWAFYEQYHLQVLALAAVVPEGESVTESHLHAWTGIGPERLGIVMQDLRSFFRHERAQNIDRFKLAHEDLRAYFRTESSWRGRLASANRTIVEYMHKRCPDGAWEMVDTATPADVYGMTHYWFHLSEDEKNEHNLERFLSYSRAMFDLGGALLKMGSVSRASSAVDRLLEALVEFQEQRPDLARGDWLAIQNALVLTYSFLAVLREISGDLWGALSEYDRVISLSTEHQALAGADLPGDFRIHLIWAYSNRGGLLTDLGDLSGALVDLKHALLIGDAMRASIGDDLPHKVQNELASAQSNIGRLRMSSQSTCVNTHYDTVISIRESIRKAMGDDWPRDYQNDLVRDYSNRGVLRKELDDPDGAREDYDNAIQIGHTLRRVAGDDYPHEYQNELARAYSNRGALREALNDPVGASTDYENAIRIGGALRVSMGDDWPHEYQHVLVVTLGNRGVLCHMMSDLSGARRYYDDAIQISEALRVEMGNEWLYEYQYILGMTYSNRGRLRKNEGDREGARQDLDEAVTIGIELQNDMGQDWPHRYQDELAGVYSTRGSLLYFANDLSSEISDHNAAIFISENLRKAMGDAWPHEYQNTLVAAYINRGASLTKTDLQGARFDYDKGICIGEALRAAMGDHWPQEYRSFLSIAFSNRAKLRLIAGDFAGASADFARAAEL